MIDRTLNYGRHHIEKFMRTSTPYTHVLDVGAGRGYDLGIAKRINSNAALYAIEGTERHVNTLTEMGVNVQQIDIERNVWPYQNDYFNLIVANQILEHTKDIFWIFHEMSRSLCLGGKLIIGLPNLASLHNRLLLLFGRQPTSIQVNSAHVRGFTKSGFVYFLESVFPGGYRLNDFGGSNFYPFPAVMAKPLARLAPNMSWGIFFLLEKRKEYSQEFLDFPKIKNLETNYYLGE